MSGQLLLNNRENTCLRIGRTFHCPGHFRDIGRNAADHLALEVFDNLRAALIPPLFRRRNLLPALQCERIGQVSIWIGLRLIVVGMIRVLFIPARARTERCDPQLIHHVLMVLFCCPVVGRQLLSGGHPANEDR